MDTDEPIVKVTLHFYSCSTLSLFAILFLLHFHPFSIRPLVPCSFVVCILTIKIVETYRNQHAPKFSKGKKGTMRQW
jgi:hypothetical protein